MTFGPFQETAKAFAIKVLDQAERCGVEEVDDPPGWWQLKYFFLIFTPIFGEDSHFD